MTKSMTKSMIKSMTKSMTNSMTKSLVRSMTKSMTMSMTKYNKFFTPNKMLLIFPQFCYYVDVYYFIFFLFL